MNRPSMTKKHFIALADAVRVFNETRVTGEAKFSCEHIYALGTFCKDHNPAFNRDRFERYIAGECGPSGGQR